MQSIPNSATKQLFDDFRRKYFTIFNYGILFIAWTMFIIALFWDLPFLPFSLTLGIISIIPAILSYSERYNTGIYIWISLVILLIFLRGIAIRSTMNFPMIIPLMILAALFTKFWFTHVIFGATLLFILITPLFGIFTYTQVADPATGLFYADVLTAFLPQFLFGYLVAWVIHKVLLANLLDLNAQNVILKETQEQLIHQEKIKSIQFLAGGIAHDFNNILTSIIGNCTLALLDMDDKEGLTRYLKQIEQASSKARQLTEKLLTFSKNTKLSRKICEIVPLLTETVEFTLQGSKHTVEWEFDENIWNVEGDEIQLSQMVQNIVINAKQAMPHGGTLKITARNYEEQEEKFIQLEFIDEGIGIKPKERKKIFKPFYTTKKEGSGLGLTIIKNIVENHQGTLEYESHLGKGTTFRIILPATDEKAPEQEDRETIMQTASYRILVLEDMEEVQNFLENIAKTLNFELTITKQGESTIEEFKRALETTPYDLVILDLTIPGGMSGIETFQSLKHYPSDAKFILSSGYLYQEALKNFDSYGFDGFLKKPYTIDEFLKQIEDVMQRKGPNNNIR